MNFSSASAEESNFTSNKKLSVVDRYVRQISKFQISSISMGSEPKPKKSWSKENILILGKRGMSTLLVSLSVIRNWLTFTPEFGYIHITQLA